ncbi:MAG: 1-deoxy-D-xylulose-5-phosphate reductoisomerase [Phycisphaeraceae bacterium]|nr:1-deoxy-D-xylulose-5-phosphate reductoisomerase [Phycisphaeraceae bacterium]
MPRRLIILGSTGSIGVNTLEVVRHLNEHAQADIEVVGLAAGSNVDLLAEQAQAFDVPRVAIADAERADALQSRFGAHRVLGGPDAALRLVQDSDATDICAAIVGSAGLAATLEAVRRGMTVSLANKEVLVAAGPITAGMLEAHGATLIPVDSEHSAIFQCLHGRMNHVGVKRLVLTASGGPFRTVDAAVMRDATVEEALNHPTWSMGPKITVDSATMMNKALEIVEAHWLFDLPGDRIDVIVHPQSIVHSFVEFDDHSILAQLGPPDMKTPIQVALTYPDRVAGSGQALDWSTIRKLDFEPPDPDKFPGLKLAYEVIEAGGTAGAVFNGANEAAVAAFLERRIRFGRIIPLVAEALDTIDTRPAQCLDDILDADRRARSVVRESIETGPPTAVAGR